MRRLYQSIVREGFKKYRQMLFLMGPRQVGKTTAALGLQDDWGEVHYFSWDNPRQRALILEGPDAVAEQVGLLVVGGEPPIVIFDEIHKSEGWKDFLKGFYDSYPDACRVLVTGSARVDFFRRGGDSLMGRYFSYRVHPLSIAEILHDQLGEGEIRKPQNISDEEFQTLLDYGGFPDPFLKRDKAFVRRWRRLKMTQLFDEDMRDLARVQEMDRMELLAELLKEQAGQLTSFESLSRKLRVANNTIRAWMKILQALYYCYEVRPWSKNVTRSLLKEPKYYLWDWSICSDPGKRAENFVASHLLKAVHLWTDHGLGDYGLHYVRDKEKREVDFLVTREGEPWMLVEVKRSMTKSLSPSLLHFQEQLQAPHVFQVAVDAPYVDKDLFELNRPMIVPARTLLSQLV